jgi:hypothetical protein
MAMSQMYLCETAPLTEYYGFNVGTWFIHESDTHATTDQRKNWERHNGFRNFMRSDKKPVPSSGNKGGQNALRICDIFLSIGNICKRTSGKIASFLLHNLL